MRKNTLGLAMVKILPVLVVRILIATGLIHLMTGFYKYAHRSLSDVLDELTDNMELKSALAFSFGDYGNLFHSIPKRTSTSFTSESVDSPEKPIKLNITKR